VKGVVSGINDRRRFYHFGNLLSRLTGEGVKKFELGQSEGEAPAEPHGTRNYDTCGSPGASPSPFVHSFPRAGVQIKMRRALSTNRGPCVRQVIANIAESTGDIGYRPIAIGR
jgi:hypothetical protein